MATDNQHLIDKLSFWHRLEFFIPYDLDGRAQERENQKKLWRPYDDATEICFSEVPEGYEVSRYTLFLGVFDKSEIRDVTNATMAAAEVVDFDEQQAASLEGQTCMASIELSSDAEPLFDTFQVSTVPWALGQSRMHGLGALANATFQTDRSRLAYLLHNYSQRRRRRSSDDNPVFPLQATEVDYLIKLLSDWSNFPLSTDRNAAMLEVIFRKQRPKIMAPKETEEPNGNDDDEPPQIGILNSFFIEDIEAAMLAAETGQLSTALRQYLTPLPPSGRLDLYSAQGRAHIWSTLAPVNTNAGRWYANPEHAMSLMQQFAINTAFKELKDEGLMSVNGPPGTGKTTLLRDIISENIVRRATVLANLSAPADAFRPQRGKGFSYLIPELAGFEMVVASSNNAAVENISKELPQSGSVSNNNIHYLRPVAHKLAAQDFGGECKPLDPEDRPWGMIAAAMGKKANRANFVDRVFFNKINKTAPKTWSGEERPLTIWQWRDDEGNCEDRTLDFASVKRDFEVAKKNVEEMLCAMQSFHDFNNLFREHDEASWCASAKLAFDESARSLQNVTASIKTASAEQADMTSHQC